MLRHLCQEFANKLLETTNFLSVSQSNDRSLACCIVAIKAGNTCELLRQNEQNGRTCIPAASLTLLNYSSLLHDSRYSRIIAPVHIIHQWSWHRTSDICSSALSSLCSAVNICDGMGEDPRNRWPDLTWPWVTNGSHFRWLYPCPNILWMWTFFPNIPTVQPFPHRFFLIRPTLFHNFDPPKRFMIS